LLAVETLVLGRGAMGEAFTQGLVHDAWHIRRDGRLIWADALHLHGDGAGEARFPRIAPWAGPGARAGHDALCGARRGRASRSGAGLAPAPHGGATSFDGMLLLRWAAPEPQALRAQVMAAVCALRAAVFGLAPRLPALWTC
jgi:urease accessory protein